MTELTSIQLTKTTRDKLKSLGRKGESYDEIICNLISLSGYTNPRPETEGAGP